MLHCMRYILILLCALHVSMSLNISAIAFFLEAKDFGMVPTYTNIGGHMQRAGVLTHSNPTIGAPRHQKVYAQHMYILYLNT